MTFQTFQRSSACRCVGQRELRSVFVDDRERTGRDRRRRRSDRVECAVGEPRRVVREMQKPLARLAARRRRRSARGMRREARS